MRSSVLLSALRTKNFMAVRWEEYVLRSFSMLWSSPMSMNRFLKTPILELSETVTGIPHWSMY